MFKFFTLSISLSLFSLVVNVSGLYEVTQVGYCSLRAGTFYNPLMFRCESCGLGCVCTLAGACASCQEGYVKVEISPGNTKCLYGTQFDSECESYEFNAAQNNIICKSCKLGALLEGICRQTDSLVGCDIENSASTGHCATCEKNFFNGGTVCQSCYNYNPEACLLPATCSASSTTCTQCKVGYTPFSQGCLPCPAGCNACTADSSNNLTCSLCQDGYFLANGKCSSCERTYNQRCNKCTSTSCTECKNLFYMDSATGRCLACKYGYSCALNSSTITGCTNRLSYVQQVSILTWYCSSKTAEHATQIDNVNNGVALACSPGYQLTPSKTCEYTQATVYTTECGQGCTDCQQVTAVPLVFQCNACEPIKYKLNAAGICIRCVITGREEDSQVFLLDANSCYSSFTTPFQWDNCLVEGGLGLAGECKVCNYGYKKTASACDPCITLTATSAVYTCKSATPVSVTFSPTAYNGTPLPDPNTQPKFYQIFLGMPLSLVNALKLTYVQPKTNSTTNTSPPQTPTNSTRTSNSSGTPTSDEKTSKTSSTFATRVSFQETLAIIILFVHVILS